MNTGPHTTPGTVQTPASHAWKTAPISTFMATCAGIGHLPGGPGTYAAAAATPLIVWMSTWPFPTRLAALGAATLLSIPWCDRAGKAFGEHDSRRIVLDEVVGVSTTLVCFSSLGWMSALVGLVAFRVFDILKPPPANLLDERGSGGLSVVLDDVIAGLWAIPLVWLARIILG